MRPGDRHLSAGRRTPRFRTDRPVGVPIGDIVFKSRLAADSGLHRAAGQFEQRTGCRPTPLGLMLNGLPVIPGIQNIVDKQRIASIEIVGVHRIAGETRAGDQLGRQNAGDGHPAHRLRQQRRIDPSVETGGVAAAIV